MDSILIDEARTPLIISGPSEESTDKYYKVNRIIPKLVRGEVIEGKEPGEKYYTGDYTVEEKHRSVALTEEGFDKCARMLNLPSLWDIEHMEWKHHVEQALKAHVLFHLDKDYVVKDDEVIIVDEFTGRLMPGRRWSDGLHQAVEAKEGVKIQRENQTLATITFQNYFRMYKKLAGMTGTAETEAAEFQKIYNLDVVVIPTNRPMMRKENPDIVYRTEDGEVPQRRQGNQGAQREGPAGSGRHHLGGEVRAPVEHPEEDGRPPRSAERQESRARSVHRGAGRAQGRGHRLHQHGRPRHRHSPRRQSRVHGQGVSPQGRPRIPTPSRPPPSELPSARNGTGSTPVQGRRRQKEHDEVVALGGLHHRRHGAPRIAPYRQPASRTRGTPGRSRQLPLLSFRCRTICCASSAASACRISCCGSAWKRMCRSSRR